MILMNDTLIVIDINDTVGCNFAVLITLNYFFFAPLFSKTNLVCSELLTISNFNFAKNIMTRLI